LETFAAGMLNPDPTRRFGVDEALELAKKMVPPQSHVQPWHQNQPQLGYTGQQQQQIYPQGYPYSQASSSAFNQQSQMQSPLYSTTQQQNYGYQPGVMGQSPFSVTSPFGFFSQQGVPQSQTQPFNGYQQYPSQQTQPLWYGQQQPLPVFNQQSQGVSATGYDLSSFKPMDLSDDEEENENKEKEDRKKDNERDIAKLSHELLQAGEENEDQTNMKSNGGDKPYGKNN
jgi:hypothetical protein